MIIIYLLLFIHIMNILIILDNMPPLRPPPAGSMHRRGNICPLVVLLMLCQPFRWFLYVCSHLSKNTPKRIKTGCFHA